MPKDHNLIIVLIIVLVVIGMLWSNRNEGFSTCAINRKSYTCAMNKDCSWNGAICVDACTRKHSKENDCKNNKDCKWKKGFLWGGTCKNK